MKHHTPSLEMAETIAFKALAFLAEDPQRLGHFLSLTGLDVDELRRHADATRTKVAVLDHLLLDESLLLVFAANAGLAPEMVAAAQRVISPSSEGEGWD